MHNHRTVTALLRRPRPDKADATRARVIEAAIKVFSRYGFRLTSMDVLAAEVPMSRQSLYNHFANKEALFAAAVQALQVSTLAAAEAAAERCRAEGGDALAELVAALVARMVAFAEVMNATPHLAELLDEQNKLCGEIVGEGQRDFREALLRRVRARRGAGALNLPRTVSSAEFVDDAMIVAVGLKYGAEALDAAAMTRRLDRMLRRMLAGAT